MFLDVKTPNYFDAVLVDSNTERSSLVVDLLADRGINVTAVVQTQDQLGRTDTPVKLVVFYASDVKAAKAEISKLSGDMPETAVLVLFDNSSDKVIHDLLEAGAHIIVPMGLGSDRISVGAITAMSIAKRIADSESEKHKALEKLENMKFIGRAKNILMSRFNETEPEAHTRLQQMSMGRNEPIHEMAKQIVEAELLLS